MIQVHINGLKQIPGIDYTATNQTISFKQAPASGDDILVTSAIPGSTTGVHMEKLRGNGHTFLYTIDNSFEQRVKLQKLLDEAWEYQGVPAVHNILEQLRVVVELVKHNDPLHQR
jgi:hypothetical protein